MKTLHKADLLQRHQLSHVQTEREVLASANNEWVVKLHFSFQDNANLYFVMDFVPGGDFMNLLIKAGRVPEYAARFYIAEVTRRGNFAHPPVCTHMDSHGCLVTFACTHVR